LVEESCVEVQIDREHTLVLGLAEPGAAEGRFADEPSLLCAKLLRFAVEILLKKGSAGHDGQPREAELSSVQPSKALSVRAGAVDPGDTFAKTFAKEFGSVKGFKATNVASKVKAAASGAVAKASSAPPPLLRTMVAAARHALLVSALMRDLAQEGDSWSLQGPVRFSTRLMGGNPAFCR
jgi:hypothetical protein